ncbi:hypothetical protein CDAR_249401 [Caerostris darwini]|uniref:Uncharacterized protein n=1 Tax=Caerostris darwini TaxID=1538125 RepID=A0AAV4TCR0_9ARAC|nr:hypothetical protein CDAR_249401 [Caerostris darwini]
MDYHQWEGRAVQEGRVTILQFHSVSPVKPEVISSSKRITAFTFEYIDNFFYISDYELVHHLVIRSSNLRRGVSGRYSVTERGDEMPARSS